MTEEAILKGCLQNEPAAQRELYNRYSPKMLSVCYRFAHNREDAEDMLQEGFIQFDNAPPRVNVAGRQGVGDN